jgi:hypothetical protein
MDDKMISLAKELTEKSELLREELIELERQFNLKREEFFKTQGSLETIQRLYDEEQASEQSEATSIVE